MSQTATAKTSNRPVVEIKAWPLRIAIWKHQNDGNGASYSAKLTRSFKKQGSEQWEDTEFLGDGDLLAAARLQERAWDWIQADREHDHARR